MLLQDGGIIHLLWHPEVLIEAADAHAAMAAVNAIAKESEYPLLVDMTATESLSRQARSVFGIRCAASRIALLGRSPVDRLLANCRRNRAGLAEDYARVLFVALASGTPCLGSPFSRILSAREKGQQHSGALLAS